MTSTGIFQAIGTGDLARLRAFLAEDASLAATRNEQGVSALLVALYHRRQDMAAELLGAGAPLDVLEGAALGRTDRVAELVSDDAGAVHAWSPDGFTPLHYSAFFGHPETLKLLLEHGADAGAVARNPMAVQPLHSAAANGSVEMVTRLLEAGAPANAKQQEGWTALHEAAKNNRLDMARALVASGADPHQPNDAGATSLDMAKDEGHDGMVALLEGG